MKRYIRAAESDEVHVSNNPDPVPFASTKNRRFMKNLKEHLSEMYDTYDWGV